MEPLAVAGGEKRRPLFAPYHRGGRRIHIGIQVQPRRQNSTSSRPNW
jgi:hypothetical protein